MISDMIMSFVSTMLGPSGMRVLDWYVQNSTYVNGFLVTIALLYIIFPKQGKKITGKIKELYLKSPLAPDEHDRQIIEEARTRYSQKSRRKGDEHAAR